MFLLALISVIGCGETQPVVDLHLEEVGPFSVSLVWETDEPAVFQIEYGEGLLYDRLAKEEKENRKHRLRLVGLKPSTYYHYRLKAVGAFAGQVTEAGFRSAPSEAGAYDLVVLDDQAGLCHAGSFNRPAFPDIVVTLSPCSGFLANRAHSILTRQIPKTGVKTIKYGRSYIVFTADISSLTSKEEKYLAEDKQIILILPQLPETLPPGWEQALVLSARGVMHQGEVTRWPKTDAAWLEVDAYEINAIIGEGKKTKRKVIVTAPPEVRKSCLYCSRLMESGRYQESLAWYRDFIEKNQDRHAIEDAYYTMARILDEKLFRYDEAIAAYREFLVRYPQSRRITLLRHRLQYLDDYQDHGFVPLERFEKAKAGLKQDQPQPTADKVSEIINEFPEAAIVKEALFWLGHLLQEKNPASARDHYRHLMQKFPTSENAALAAIALGDMDYQAKDYRQAVTTYSRAMERVPERYHLSIADKLRKSKRNIWRERARWLAWIVLAFWLVLSMIWKIRPSWHDLWLTLVVLAGYLLLVGAFFAITFETTREMLWPVGVVSLATIVLFFWNTMLVGQESARRSKWAVAHALTTSSAVIFLIVYHFHYLYIFGI